MIYRRVVKRLFDFLAALVLSVLLLPLGLVLVLVVAVANNGKVFYVQKRPGLGERPFSLVKLRTMRDPLAGENEHSEARITKLGRWLRRTGLDELPQLLNILVGDLSFVGPRPLLSEYLERYAPADRVRHSVRPGLTGLVQVSGGNRLAWVERFDLDRQYVAQLGFKLDVSILWRTATQRLGRRAPEPLVSEPYSAPTKPANTPTSRER